MFQRKKLVLAVGAAMSAMLATGLVQAQGDDQIEEIVVTGIKASLARSIDIKRNSSLVSDSITAEDMGKFPDNNIADSLQRIPGVAIDRAGGEGRYVSIRGLGPDFASVLINGRTAASENEERAFSFDTIASELVRSVDVFKTSNAALKEGGLGGTVNIVTARPFDFDGFHLSGSLKGMYEENSEDVSPQGSLLFSNTFADDRIGVLGSITYQKRSTSKYTVTNEHISNTNEEPFLTFTDPSQGWGGGYAYSGDGLEEDTWRTQALWSGITEEERERIGGNLVVQFQLTDNIVLTADAIYSKYDTSTDYFYNGSYLWAPTLSDVNQIDENGFYNVINHGYDDGYNITGYGHGLQSTERPTETLVGGFNLQWDISDELRMVADVSRSTATLDNRGLDRLYILEMLDMPGYIVTSNGGIPTVEYKDYDAVMAQEGSDNQQNLRLRQTSDDGIYNDATNEEFKVDFAWEPGDGFFNKVNFGANYMTSEKVTEFWQTPNLVRRIYHSHGTKLPIDYNSIVDGVIGIGDRFGGLNGDIYRVDPVAFREFAVNSVEDVLAIRPAAAESIEEFYNNGSSFDAVRSNNSYQIEEKVTSAYVDFSKDVEVADMPLNITAGVRYTHTDLTSSGTSQVLLSLTPEVSLPGEPPKPTLVKEYADEAGTLLALENSYENWLPSLSLKLDVTDDFVVRAAASQTLTRPTLSALAPQISYGATTKVTRSAISSNPALKPFLSTNYDLSFEYYYNSGSMIALALFQKDIDDYIVRRSENVTLEGIAVDDPSWLEFDVTRPVNGRSATVEGAEVNWIHLFDNGFGFSANFTAVDSNASVISNDDVEVFALPGISDTGNVSVFYDNNGFQARVSYNKRTDFLSRVFNGPSNEPVHTDAYQTVDVSVSYDLTENLTVFVDGSNVTGEVVEKYGRYKNQFMGYEDTGALYTFGVRAKF